MGIDVHTDVRLNNGADSVLTSFLNYADFDEGYFAHTNTTPKNALATYEGCYATQWYLGFLNNGGAGHPYSLYYQRFDFSRKLSTEADITSFTLEGQEGVFTTEGEDSIITVTLPTGTPTDRAVRGRKARAGYLQGHHLRERRQDCFYRNGGGRQDHQDLLCSGQAL